MPGPEANVSDLLVSHPAKASNPEFSCSDVLQLSKEELVQTILALYQQNEESQAAIAQLKADNEALRLKLERGKKPPTNSSNSSQPPSRDHKRSLPADRRKRKHGPPAGHAKHERQFVANPDHVVELKAETCRHCATDMRKAEAVLRDVNQITELPPARAEVIEVRQYEVTCPGCGKVHLGKPPVGLEMDRMFGARLEATVVYYRQEQHISYQRTERALQDLHGVKISQGGIDKIMQRAGNKAIQEVEPIQEACASERCYPQRRDRQPGGRADLVGVGLLHADRRIACDPLQSQFGRDPRRHGTIQAEVWVSDCLTAQLKAPAQQRQLCLAHQLRNLQAVVDLYPTAFLAAGHAGAVSLCHSSAWQTPSTAHRTVCSTNPSDRAALRLAAQALFEPGSSCPFATPLPQTSPKPVCLPVSSGC